MGVDRDILPWTTVDLHVLHGYYHSLQAATGRLLFRKETSIGYNVITR